MSAGLPMAKTHVVEIPRSRTTLLPHQVAALASEFYGTIGKTTKEDMYRVEFSIKTKADAFDIAASGFAPRASSTS